jgi:PAS domain-containing protein
MIDHSELGLLLGGLRAVITVADEDGRIVFMNDLAIQHYGDRGGAGLIGRHLHDCHNPASQRKIRQMYARHGSGDLTPTRYHEEREDRFAESIVVIPMVIEGRFRGVAELMWTERPELVHEL